MAKVAVKNTAVPIPSIIRSRRLNTTKPQGGNRLANLRKQEVNCESQRG